MIPLSLGLLSIFHGLAATAPAPFTSNLGGTVHLLNSSICLPPLYLPTYHPAYFACIHAIRALPSSDHIGVFHTHPHPPPHLAHDPFLLPFVEVYHHNEGSCEIKVELEPGIQNQRGSWNEIGRAARSVAEDCKEVAEGREITGGHTLAGIRGGIVVRLEKVVMKKGIQIRPTTPDDIGADPTEITDKASLSLV